ncbi:MAG TPA: ethanolamine ammonia-lyase reactivating factor EutA, partial [Pirellulales bacterium]|nr:ethanolamine ammonia-lyase reactivating factor EutA [Pirellulales bacterium]
MSNSSEVRLVGLDFGSTTTSGVVARASIQSAPDRPAELADVAVEYRSSPVFTPFCGEALNEVRLAEWLDDWSRAAGLIGQDIGGGGAIVTGLAARASNAQIVRRLVQERFGQTLIATADDPALESWLAFMANCRDLSLAEPARLFLNFDIGGGTTNVALGRAGEIRAVGCYQLGARHVRLKPGGYTIVGCSAVGRRLLDDLDIDRRDGDQLLPSEVATIVDFIVASLEALAAGPASEPFFIERSYLVDLPFMPGAAVDEAPVITYSGGVGELVYRSSLGEDLPGTTAFGDLGIDLARRIKQSPLLSRCLTAYRPAALGRATV